MPLIGEKSELNRRPSQCVSRRFRNEFFEIANNVGERVYGVVVMARRVSLVFKPFKLGLGFE